MIEQQEIKPNKFQKLFKILKIGVVVLIILAVLITGYFAYRLSQKDLFGWRLNFNLSKVETGTYTSFAPNIAFLYPKIFEIDSNRERYGKGYLVGIKLKTDDRTGCDVRLGGPELDFSKNVNDLTDEIVSPIKNKASDFKLIENKKTKIGGRDALRISFSFLDPIGARIRLDQAFIKDKSARYFIICGTGEYQYDFFRKDFNVFYDSINFEGNISDFETNRSWYRALLEELFFWRK
ncbi:MAG TPA: hypothetical protein DCS28_04300 [Candidatus Moranbacteria bacterium]|nr:hypothetical protein [Candidatus Moranbacteria bacterium]HAT75231.1 hypothetical protein [Candidatus Moranbacteria bacterium]